MVFPPVDVVFGRSAIWEKFPKFANDFQGVAAQDISRVSGRNAMKSQGGQRARDDGAPLVAVAGRRSGATGGAQRGMPRAVGHARRREAIPSRRRRRCWSALRAQWASLPAHAVRRLVGRAIQPVRCRLRVGAALARAAHARRARIAAARRARVFRADMAARSITRRMLVYGWHLARSRPRAACLVFGSHHRRRRIAGGLFAGRARSRRRTQCRRVAAALAEPVWLLARAAARGVSRRRPAPARTTARRLQRLAAETLAAHAP